MNKIFYTLSGIILAAGVMASPAPMEAQELAISGYDPVAYFTSNKPVKGSAQYQLAWNNALWFFSSPQNRKAFQNDPQKYSPQYNGWCAYAVSQGYVAEVDPVNGWTLENGKLYLNWSRAVKYLWLARKKHHITQADMNWPNIYKKLKADQAEINRK